MSYTGEILGALVEQQSIMRNKYLPSGVIFSKHKFQVLPANVRWKFIAKLRRTTADPMWALKYIAAYRVHGVEDILFCPPYWV